MMLEHELAAHACGQLAADGQAEPETGLTAGVAPALEALEDQLALFQRHAWPLVDHAQRGYRVVAEFDSHPAPLRAGAHCIVGQDAEYACHASWVAECPHGAGPVVA